VNYTVWLRQDNRALVAAAPESTPMPPALTANTIQLTFEQTIWAGYDAIRQTLPAGQDLVIDVFGGTSSTPHTPSIHEQALLDMRAYQALGSPNATQVAAGLRATITYLLTDVTLASNPQMGVLLASPIRQSVTRRVLRARSRSRSTPPSPTLSGIRPPIFKARQAARIRPVPPQPRIR
jgi:hypothetical protein